MPVKIDMDMPKVCANCPLYKEPEDKEIIYFMGFPIGGKCKALPIKDLNGKTISYQTVGTIKEIEHEERSKHCPLKECVYMKEQKAVKIICGEIVDQTYKTWYDKAEAAWKALMKAENRRLGRLGKRSGK